MLSPITKKRMSSSQNRHHKSAISTHPINQCADLQPSSVGIAFEASKHGVFISSKLLLSFDKILVSPKHCTNDPSHCRQRSCTLKHL